MGIGAMEMEEDERSDEVGGLSAVGCCSGRVGGGVMFSRT
jgi:hypothetical protein